MASENRECGVLALSLAMLTILCSSSLISFNKYLIHKDRFPFATVLVITHMSVSLGLSGTLYAVKPSFFPALTDPEAKVTVDRKLFFKGLLPIGMFFVVQLVLSNGAYLYASVAFLQMMKESNLVLVYLLSLLAALEHFKCRNLCLLVLILIATTMTIKGELHFSTVGFAMQGTSQLFESSKIVLQGLLLSAGGIKLDPFSYVLLMTPGCLVFLLCLLGFLCVHPVQSMPVPAWSDISNWWQLLLVNALVAYSLNLVSAAFIKNSSPTAFILAGIVKDASIVLAGVAFLGEDISRLQAFGFAMQLSLIFLWTLMKTFPQSFEDGIVSGLLSFVIGPKKGLAGSDEVGPYKAVEEGTTSRASNLKTA